MKITDHVKGRSSLMHYKDRELWYTTDDTGFKFPVPIEDAGTATFYSNEKSLLLMRYIRKWMDVLEKQDNGPIV